jgi:hypothetical protein
MQAQMIGKNKGKKQKPVNSSQAKALILMAPQVRLELTTLRLTVKQIKVDYLILDNFLDK